MSPSACAVHACVNPPEDQLIVATGGTVALAGVCALHGDEIRSGRRGARRTARPGIQNSGATDHVDLELLPDAV